MSRISLGKVLIEQKEAVGVPDGNSLPLIGVNNKTGLHLSRYSRLPDVSRYKLLKKHWFAYNPMRINIGSIGYADAESKTGIISPDYVVFSCSELILPEYFFHFIKSEVGLLEISKNTGGSVRERLYFRSLAKMKIELPSIEEQKSIVYALIKRKELITALLDECVSFKNDIQLLRQTILQEAVQGKLTRQDEHDEPASELLKRIKAEKQKLVKEGKLKKEKDLPPITEEQIAFELPKGWVWCRLGEVCIKIGSGSTPKGGKEVYASSGIKFIRSQNVYNDGLTFDNVVFIDEAIHKKMEGTKVIPNDILLNITGGSIGRCALVPSDFDEANVNQHVTIIRTIDILEREYIHQLIISPYFQDYIMAAQTGGNREGLAKKNMELMLIPLPPVSEQQQIILKVKQLQQQLNSLETQVQQSKIYAQQLLQTILNEAFAEKGKKYKLNKELSLAAED